MNNLLAAAITEMRVIAIMLDRYDLPVTGRSGYLCDTGRVPSIKRPSHLSPFSDPGLLKYRETVLTLYFYRFIV